MRWCVLPFALLASACGPQAAPGRSAQDRIDPGPAWPLILAHCLRSPDCDPSAGIGEGAEEASNTVGSIAWFAQSKARVKEGAEDYGASLRLSLFGQRGVGGEAGRPLSIDELPDSLVGLRAKRTTLSIEYRTPVATPEPYFLQVTSPWLTGLAAGVDEANVEILGAKGVLYSADAGGMEPPQPPTNGEWTPPKAMVFYVSRNLRDEPLPDLMAALAKGESLSIRLMSAGGVLFRDVLYADGYGAALDQAAASIADPAIAQPIGARCTGFAAKPDEFWKAPAASAAQLVCDPRLPEQRR